MHPSQHARKIQPERSTHHWIPSQRTLASSSRSQKDLRSINWMKLYIDHTYIFVLFLQILLYTYVGRLRSRFNGDSFLLLLCIVYIPMVRIECLKTIFEFVFNPMMVYVVYMSKGGDLVFVFVLALILPNYFFGSESFEFFLFKNLWFFTIAGTLKGYNK